MTKLLDIVASRGKAEILRLLFGVCQPEMHLRELVRQSGLSLGTIQQELRRLALTGVVAARRDGNRLYYRANQQHPIHPELHSLVLKTSGLASVLAEALKDGEIELAFVFGSVARGEARAGSDLDLMVIGPASLRRVAGMLSGAAGRLGLEINPHVLSAGEFKARKRQGDHFLTAVLASPKVFVKGTADELVTMGE